MKKWTVTIENKDNGTSNFINRQIVNGNDKKKNNNKNNNNNKDNQNIYVSANPQRLNIPFNKKSIAPKQASYLFAFRQFVQTCNTNDFHVFLCLLSLRMEIPIWAYFKLFKHQISRKNKNDNAKIVVELIKRYSNSNDIYDQNLKFRVAPYQFLDYVPV